MTGKFRGLQNPYDLGCWRNCVSVLCAAKTPRYMHYKTKDGHSSGETPRQGNNDLRIMPIYEDLDDSTLQRERVRRNIEICINRTHMTYLISMSNKFVIHNYL